MRKQDFLHLLKGRPLEVMLTDTYSISTRIGVSIGVSIGFSIIVLVLEVILTDTYSISTRIGVSIGASIGFSTGVRGDTDRNIQYQYSYQY